MSQALKAARFFSSTATRHHGFISHVGRKPIQIQPSVTLTTSPTSITVQGPLGETSVALEPFIKLLYPQPDVIQLAVDDPSLRKQRQMWGLTRALLNNAMTGLTEGFSVNLYLVGVGYRAALEEDPRGTSEGGNGQRLNMKLGFSHPVFQPIPADIKADVPTATKISLFCTDKQRLGQFAAEIRQWRKPEPYKGKVRSCYNAISVALVLSTVPSQGDFHWERADKDKSCQEEINITVEDLLSCYYLYRIAWPHALIFSVRGCQPVPPNRFWWPYLPLRSWGIISCYLMFVATSPTWNRCTAGWHTQVFRLFPLWRDNCLTLNYTVVVHLCLLRSTGSVSWSAMTGRHFINADISEGQGEFLFYIYTDSISCRSFHNLDSVGTCARRIIL